MIVSTRHDEVLFQALSMSVVPTDEEIAAVDVPPGEDPAAFAAKLKQITAEIVALRKSGQMGAARKLANSAIADYRAATKDAPARNDSKLAEKASAGEIAARPVHLQANPLASPAELAARVVGRVGR